MALSELDWHTTNDCQVLLAFLGGQGVGLAGPASERKARLLAVAFSRLAWEDVAVQGRNVLEVAECVADGLAPLEALARAYPDPQDMEWLRDAWRWSRDVGQWACGLSGRRFESDDELASVVRDLFGNPFRRERLDARWLAAADGAVRRLAEFIYHERCYEVLPVLADALEEAGCGSAAVLEHCRAAKPHARGCWVLDLVMDRR